MWRWIDPELSEDAACVRRDHPFWQAIIDLPHGPDGRTRLMLVARRGKLARVEALIAWHADVNAVNKYGNTTLILASRYGLAKVAGVDAANNSGLTALVRASCNGHVEVVRALLAAGAGVDAAANDGWTALIHASDLGDLRSVRVLLAAGAGVDAADINGWTPLIHASESGQVKVVRALLAAGANKHLIALDGVTAYSCAARAADSPAFTAAAVRALLDLAP